jgi:hypothetical protein
MDEHNESDDDEERRLQVSHILRCRLVIQVLNLSRRRLRSLKHDSPPSRSASAQITAPASRLSRPRGDHAFRDHRRS